MSAASRAAALDAQSARTVVAGREALRGSRRGVRALLPFLGPAFIASVAYIDPGNFATDIQGGAQFGFGLLWVVVLAGAAAMFVQLLSAKVGLATGSNLAELCRIHYGDNVAYALWVIGEIAAMATDVAEFVGAALGFYLLAHVPLMIGAVLAGITTIALLALERHGFRRLEAAIAAFVLVVSLAYVFEVVVAAVHPNAASPTWLARGPNALYLAIGIVGATIMPHVVFLHSSLTQRRIAPERDGELPLLYRFVRADVIIALSLAAVINAAIMISAALALSGDAHASSNIVDAHRMLAPLLGPASAAVFAVALLASGLSSSTVGTMAGQVIMQGFVGFNIPLWVRRAVTMLPSFVVVALGLEPQGVIVFTQVVLAFALPFALVPLADITSRAAVMGQLANSRAVAVVAWLLTTGILTCNVMLLIQAARGR